MIRADVVGNDVVDLDDPEAAGASRRERFVRRILCDEELRMMEGSADPDAFLWTAFAAKEAAYKAVVQLRGRAPSAPRAYEVAPDLRSVRLPGMILHLLVEAGRERYVHAIAWSGDRPAFGCGTAGIDPGRSARELLVASAAATFGCAPSRLRVVRSPLPGSWDGFGPPRLELDGSPVPAAVSLSHHGRYASWAHGLPV